MRRKKNCIAFYKLGLTKLIYNMYFCFKFVCIKSNIVLALPAASLHWCENVRLDAIITPRSLTLCTLSSFTRISYSCFLVSSFHLKNMAFVNMKRERERERERERMTLDRKIKNVMIF